MLNETIKKFLKKGKELEQKFANDLLSSKGGEIKMSNKNDDINKHIDLYWKPMNFDKWCSIDVKGLRKNNRNDNNYSNDFTWLEIKNVNGKNGSLYGEANYIAFELDKSWIIVKRSLLVEKVEKNIIDEKIYNYNPNCNFKLYQRNGRKDLIIRVPYSFIIEEKSFLIDKI